MAHTRNSWHIQDKSSIPRFQRAAEFFAIKELNGSYTYTHSLSHTHTLSHSLTLTLSLCPARSGVLRDQSDQRLPLLLSLSLSLTHTHSLTLSLSLSGPSAQQSSLRSRRSTAMRRSSPIIRNSAPLGPYSRNMPRALLPP